MKNFLILTTSNYNRVNGGFEPSRGNINERITFRGNNQGFHILNYSERLPLTKLQKLINYECRCIEQGIKPYHYTLGEWEQTKRDIKSEEHSERCAEKYDLSRNY